MALVDILAIAPFYLSAFFVLDLRFLRVLRLLRIVKLTRYSRALNRLLEVYQLQRSALTASFFLMAVVIVLSAGIVYVAEHPAPPEAFGSIPAAMWWAVCTLTTVGYGDVLPITPLGKLLSAGIQLYVEPEIAQEIIRAAQRKQSLADLDGCPHCGKPLT